MVPLGVTLAILRELPEDSTNHTFPSGPLAIFVAVHPTVPYEVIVPAEVIL